LIEKYSSKDPKLILAVPASLSHGPSRHLFADFAAIPDNVILLTGHSEDGTLARLLFDRWNDGQRVENKWDNGKIGISVMMDGSLKLKVSSIPRLFCSNYVSAMTMNVDELESSSTRSRT
jgi:cleavage and polyadenylation specificity factor subunit 2